MYGVPHINARCMTGSVVEILYAHQNSSTYCNGASTELVSPLLLPLVFVLSYMVFCLCVCKILLKFGVKPWIELAFTKSLGRLDSLPSFV